MSEEKYISIGKIVNTHGHRGELRIFPLTDFPKRFLTMDAVTLYSQGMRRDMHIERARLHKQYVIVQFKEVPDMNEAEKLKGALLQITKEQLVALPEDSFYVFDIIGLKVFDPQGVYLGIVEDIIQTGANDVYVVAGEKGKPLLVPALKDVVKQVDIQGGKMVVVLLEEEEG